MLKSHWLGLEESCVLARWAGAAGYLLGRRISCLDADIDCIWAFLRRTGVVA